MVLLLVLCRIDMWTITRKNTKKYHPPTHRLVSGRIKAQYLHRPDSQRPMLQLRG